MRTRHSLIALFASAACSEQPCDDVSSACVVVGISSAQILAIDELSLDVSFHGDTEPFHETVTVIAASGGVTELPVITAIDLAPEQPTVVSIVGAGKLGGTVLGIGFDETAPLLDGHRAQLAINLVPSVCRVGGIYCGDVMFPGHPTSRYECIADGAPSLVERCPGACIRVGDGSDICGD